MTFGATAFLWTLGLITVPVIIHLLNRRRYRDIDWAPMKYLKLSIRTNRRKIRLEQLLLLLVRTLFVAGIVLAICRPKVTQGGGLDWLAFRAKVSRLIVVDDSLSTGARSGDRSSFSVAKDAALKLIQAMDTDDALTVVVTSDPSRPIAESAQVGDERTRGPMSDAVRALQPTHTGTLWSEVLEQADRHLARAPFPVREVTIITDLRAPGWTDEVQRTATRLATADVRLRIVDAGLSPTGNIALVGLEMVSPVALKGIPSEFVAEVRNDGTGAFGPIAASLTVGESRRTVRIPRIATGETLKVSFSVTFRSDGAQAVGLELPDDVLPLDNARWFSVDVRSHLNLILVDGDPSTEAFQSETDFLQVAFTIGEVPWRVYAITDAEWLSGSVPEADLTVLANVGALRSEHVDRLETLVRRGMGLALFPGDQTDAETWNELLWKNGSGLSPARVMGFREEVVTGLVVEPEDDSPLEMLTRVAPESMKKIAAEKMLDLLVPTDEAVRVLARWDDADRKPAVIERRVGRGRVLMFSTTADRAWTDWPTEPTWLLSMREAGLRVADPGVAGLNLEAGQAVVVPVGTDTAEDPEVTAPGGEAPVPLQVRSDGGPRALVHERTAVAGVYGVTWKDERNKTISRQIAINPSVSESDLKALDRRRLDELLGPMRPTMTHHSDLDRLIEGEGREIWRTLVTLALVMLVIESFLMVYVGRQG